jgi:hypothetical protein
MHIKYLGGKTNYEKWVHVFYDSEYAHNPDIGWMPKDNKLNEWLDLKDGTYCTPTLWGNYVFVVHSNV